MKKHLLVTGGSGFIGKNIVEQLGRKYHIDAPSHKTLDLTDADAVKTYLKSRHIDVVIHTANVGGNKNEAHIPDVVTYNLRIFFNLVRNSRYFKKFIYLGSGTQYGKQSPIVRVQEEDFDKRMPADEFGLYKYTCAKYIEESKINMLNLCIFGIYGKHEEYAFRFISQSLCRVLFDMPIVINQNVRFDYLYVDDFVQILDYFIEHETDYRTYNVGTGSPIDLVMIAKRILAVTKKDLPITVVKPGLNLEYTCCADRLHNEIRDLKYTDFDTTLLRLYDWYRERKNTIQRVFLV